eukprot:UN09629
MFFLPRGIILYVQSYERFVFFYRFILGSKIL